ncbi:MAG TPA: DinB family protein [Chryseosolibacter sp.]
MTASDAREVWQRGPVPGVPALLQPVAHALLQATEDAEKYMEGFPSQLLWVTPGGVASAGFHLLHMSGVVDRLFTYARGESLSERQLKNLAAEKEVSGAPIQPGHLVDAFRAQVETAISQLKKTSESTLTETRFIGRKQIPTTVQGLLFHAAEHCQRHMGQLLVTARILQARIV